MTDHGRLRETYHAALQHDLIDLTGDEHLAGVVRRPTGWFRSVVDANYPVLGPPPELLEETKAVQEELQLDGMCDEEAHNAAWGEVGFAERYREYAENAAAADERLDELAARLRDGHSVVLVCFEGETKRCHRYILREILRERL